MSPRGNPPTNNARERLSLDALEAWETGGIEAEPNYHGLPLFKE